MKQLFLSLFAVVLLLNSCTENRRDRVTNAPDETEIERTEQENRDIRNR